MLKYWTKSWVELKTICTNIKPLKVNLFLRTCVRLIRMIKTLFWMKRKNPLLIFIGSIVYCNENDYIFIWSNIFCSLVLFSNQYSDLSITRVLYRIPSINQLLLVLLLLNICFGLAFDELKPRPLSMILDDILNCLCQCASIQ